MRHRWKSPRRAKGVETECMRCGTARRYMDSTEVKYLRPDVSGWVDAVPDCDEVSEAMRVLEQRAVQAESRRRAGSMPCEAAGPGSS